MKRSVFFYLTPLGFVAIGAAMGWMTAPDVEQTPVTAATRSDVRLPTPAFLPTGPSVAANAAGNPGAVDESIEMAMSYPSSLHRSAALKRYFDALDANEFGVAFGKVRPIAETQPDVMEMLARAWAERAPEIAGRTLLTLPEGTLRSRTLGAFARAWGRKNSPVALAWVEENLKGTDLENARLYLKNLAAVQSPPPKKSLQEILTVSSSSERHSLLYRHFLDLLKVNPEEALKQTLMVPDNSDRHSMQSTVALNWAQQDPAAFLQWLKNKELKEPSKGTEWTDWSSSLTTAGTQLLSKDSGLVHQLISEFPEGAPKRNLANLYATKLVKEDPDAALAFVEDLKSRDPAFNISGILPELLAKDPEKGGELLLAELQKHTGKYAASAPDYATLAMKSWIKQDAAAAANFATKLPENTMPQVFYAVADVWCARDGKAALDWATKLPSGKAKEHALREFTYIWAKHDTKQSTTWLNALPADASRWAATEGFVFSTIDTDPDAAIGWARSIPDEAKRLDVLARAWSKWNQNNSQSAIDWLTTGELSEDERDAILSGWK
jgi:hypothetical protein